MVLSVYFIVQMAGASAGQAMAGIGDASDALMFGVASILISLSFLPVLVSQNPAPDWSAPIEWSSLIFSAWSVFGLSERCFRALVGGIPERCAV